MVCLGGSRDVAVASSWGSSGGCPWLPCRLSPLPPSTPARDSLFCLLIPRRSPPSVYRSWGFWLTLSVFFFLSSSHIFFSPIITIFRYSSVSSFVYHHLHHHLCVSLTFSSFLFLLYFFFCSFFFPVLSCSFFFSPFFLFFSAPSR